MKMNLTTSEKNRGFVRFLLMSLLLSILILPAHAQDRVTVSGQLTDSSQTPLIGASVIERARPTASPPMPTAATRFP
ncbi:MAG: hypothetical protein ACLRSE_13800 [Alistipes finegoldii]